MSASPVEVAAPKTRWECDACGASKLENGPTYECPAGWGQIGVYRGRGRIDRHADLCPECVDKAFAAVHS